MPATEKKYPEWVQTQRTRGTTVKRKGDTYYLYKRTSRPEKGSRRRPKPAQDEEMGRIKREHWSVENRLHHVLDDTFREDRSSAKKSKNNLALVRKFAYNILWIAMLSGDCSKIMTEAMDDFSDDLELRKKYVFNGINSFY